MPKKIIIDTDPGIDDAMAILFALCSPELDLVGLTTVFGNVYTDLATKNALRLLEFAGRTDIPVAHGAHCPLHAPLEGVADYVHGVNGLGDVLHGDPIGKPDTRLAAQFLVEMIMNNPGEITLIPIGPLTNLALALTLEPRMAQNVAEVIIMGGAATVNGNTNPAAEANVWNDPHAADRVFTAHWPVTMIGLDVTEKTVMDADYFTSLRRSRTGAYIDDISQFYIDYHYRIHGMRACHTHDPSAVAYAIDSTLFTAKVGPIRVVTEGIARGQTLWDRRQEWHAPNDRTGRPMVNVCINVDDARLLELYRQRIWSA